MKEITQNELGTLRQRLLEEQGFKCKICQKTLDPKDPGNCCVDHQHLFKSDDLEIHGNGLIRGVLCRDCNALEGKIWNALHRFGKSDSNDPVNSRAKWISRLLDYWGDNLSHREPILHPKERRIEKLSKQGYNDLIRYFKSLDSSYKRNGELKNEPKFTGRWSPTLTELKEMKEKDEGWELRYQGRLKEAQKERRKAKKSLTKE